MSDICNLVSQLNYLPVPTRVREKGLLECRTRVLNFLCHHPPSWPPFSPKEPTSHHFKPASGPSVSSLQRSLMELCFPSFEGQLDGPPFSLCPSPGPGLPQAPSPQAFLASWHQPPRAKFPLLIAAHPSPHPPPALALARPAGKVDSLSSVNGEQNHKGSAWLGNCRSWGGVALDRALTNFLSFVGLLSY